MFNWLFKKVVTFREKVAVDLGQGDDEKPFLDHLDDLRTMIVRMAVTLLVMTLCTFFFIEELMTIMTYPLTLAGIEQQVTLQNLDPTGGFMTAMNVALVASVILAFPVLLYFLLQFILPGLRNNEKKVLFPALGVGGGLFLMGVLFAYFVVSPRALTFFYEFSRDMGAVSKQKKEEVQTTKEDAPPATPTSLPDLKPGTRLTATTPEGKSFVFEVLEVQAPQPGANKPPTSTPGSTGPAPAPTPGTTTAPPAGTDGSPATTGVPPEAAATAGPAVAVATMAPATPFIWELKQYVKFICQFILIFGACFELPVVVMALVKLDVLNYKVMKTSRSWAAVIICIVAALITPTSDAMTLGLLAVPMYLLYEICIWLAWWLEKRDRALYPEYYKEQEEIEKELEVSDEWDNENYNPWGGGDDEENEDEGGGSKPKPTPTPPAGGANPEGQVEPDAAAKADAESSISASSPSNLVEDSVPDTSYSPPESSISSDSPDEPTPKPEPETEPETGPEPEPEQEPEPKQDPTDAPEETDDWSLKKDKPGNKEKDEPSADKRDTD